jgi:hypothetical protein
LEIRDKVYVSGLSIVLILKSETKVGVGLVGVKKFFFRILSEKIFFPYIERKSFAALRFAHNNQKN